MFGLALTAGPATAGTTTLDQTIAGEDPAGGFSFLNTEAGEQYTVREDLAAAQSGRETRRTSVLYFGQLSDFQLPDEESPSRVELIDADPTGTASSAHRPQETLLAQQADRSIRQMNKAAVASPVADKDGAFAAMANVVLTGDLADSQQLNETRWVRTLLDGGGLTPNSGTNAPCLEGDVADKENPRRYTGVQDYDDYLLDSPAFYDPERPSGQYADWPVYEGLLDRAQERFKAQGLNVPSYVAFGNHDGLVQGNQAASAPIELLATGCVKPLLGVSDAVLSPTAPDSLPPFADILDPVALEEVLAETPSQVMLVPPDAKRRFVTDVEYKKVFQNGEQDDGHGFDYVDEDELAASAGAASYYSFDQGDKVRFITLDTVSDAGVTPISSEGNIDAPQFAWLEQELQEAETDGKLVVVYGHHAPSTSLEANLPDELATPCVNGLNDLHGHDLNPGCDRDPRSSSPIKVGADVTNLLLQYPNVIAVVAGHSHNSQITPIEGADGSGYWEIKSPAVADWPTQSRLIEVMDNDDGTLSIFGTMLDHAGPVTSPATTTQAETDALSVGKLASIGRTIAYNDPQAGPSGAQGSPTDRNVELLIDDPR